MVLVVIMEVFVTGILHSFGNDNSKRRMSCSCIGMGLVMGMLYMFWLGYWKVLVMGILFTFAIIIVTVVVVAGVI